MEKKYPKIYLAMDNCVLYKRWTTPDSWSKVIKDLGVNYIEASADTELDPLYMGKEYLEDWIEAVKEAEEKHGVKVCNLYSGHGSYTTLGVAHPDKRVRDNMVENFIFPLIRAAAKLESGVGFFAHAFANDVLQSEESYNKYVDILLDELSKIASYAKEQKCLDVGIEKMYTPHQYPWRNKDIYELLKEVKIRSGHNFYLTEDTGHHHNKFEAPSDETILKNNPEDIWLGTNRAYDLAKADKEGNLSEIRKEIENNPQLFSSPCDRSTYDTLRQFGCYSPIVHLQQTNGTVSAHLPFTEEENKKGMIDGFSILKALKESYDAPLNPEMPKRCDKIYLTLELFSGTTSIMEKVLKDCKESVEYWRKFIPEDGMYLDELI